MGYSSDLGTSVVKDICPMTGYPRDEYGHLLRSISHNDGHVIENWDKPGKVLYNFTAPYGHLEFCVGSDTDFYCYDYEVIDAGSRGQFIVLHSVVNSETGHFIDGVVYDVLPVNTVSERREAVRAAHNMIACMDDITHDKRGWNQDDQYFGRAVANALFSHMFSSTATQRMLRFGGKRVDSVVNSILNPTEEKPAKARRSKKRNR